MFVKFGENVFYEFQNTNFKVCTDVLTFWFITYKRCMFVHHDVQVFLCTCVYLVPLQHSSTFTYMYWAPFSMKQLILFPIWWSCHWVDFILSKLLRYIYLQVNFFELNNYLFNLMKSISNNILLSAWFWS